MSSLALLHIPTNVWYCDCGSIWIERVRDGVAPDRVDNSGNAYGVKTKGTCCAGTDTPLPPYVRRTSRVRSTCTSPPPIVIPFAVRIPKNRRWPPSSSRQIIYLNLKHVSADVKRLPTFTASLPPRTLAATESARTSRGCSVSELVSTLLVRKWEITKRVSDTNKTRVRLSCVGGTQPTVGSAI